MSMMGFVAGQMCINNSPAGNVFLNGSQYLSQSIDSVISKPCSMIIDFIPHALPPQTGGYSYIQALTFNPTAAAPFLNLSPKDTEYLGLGMIRGAAPIQQISLDHWVSLSVGKRYKITVTMNAAGLVKAYVNGVSKYQLGDIQYRRPTSICGRAGAGQNCLNGEFVQFAILSAELSAAQVAAIAGDDSYDLISIPSVTDLWIGSDIRDGVIANRVIAGPPLTLITKV